MLLLKISRLPLHFLLPRETCQSMAPLLKIPVPKGGKAPAPKAPKAKPLSAPTAPGTLLAFPPAKTPGIPVPPKTSSVPVVKLPPAPKPAPASIVRPS